MLTGTKLKSEKNEPWCLVGSYASTNYPGVVPFLKEILQNTKLFLQFVPYFILQTNACSIIHIPN